MYSSLRSAAVFVIGFIVGFFVEKGPSWVELLYVLLITVSKGAMCVYGANSIKKTVDTFNGLVAPPAAHSEAQSPQ